MHIHVPDGILPIWLWLAGLVIISPAAAISLWHVRRQQKKSVLTAMFSAVLLVVFSLEFFGFHLNLTPLAGILLGPWWSLISVLIVNVFLALFGHGGITLIGLNTLLNWIEALLSYYSFTALVRMLKKKPARLSITAGLIAFLSLVASFILFVGIVAVSQKSPISFMEESTLIADLSLSTFVALSAPFIIISALIEGFLTSFVINYIIRVKPELLYGI